MKAGISSAPEVSPGVEEPQLGWQQNITPNDFMGDLASCYDGRIRTLPPFEANLNHQGRIPTDTEQYRRMVGVYMAPEITDAAGGAYVPRFNFTPKPFRGLGRENSRRKVFFGDLDLVGDETVQSYPVAVKPFKPGSFHTAVHEIGMFHYMESLGLPTLHVLGMVAVTGGEMPRSYAITREQPGITTLDNVLWREMEQAERWTSVRPAIETLVTLHGMLRFHGDLEFKNAAFGEQDRSLCVVDPEEMVSLRDVVEPDKDDPMQRSLVVKKMSADFVPVSNSVSHEIIPKGIGEKEQFEDLLEHVYSPYYLALLRTESPYKDVLVSAFGEMLEQKRQQAYGEWTGRSIY